MSLTTVDGSLISSGAITLTTQVTGTLPVANGGTGVTTSTGSGANVLSTSPTLVTPILGTPTSGNLANCTGVSNTAKAWVNFNGVSGVTVNSSFNVSSVTRGSTGQYVVNFTNAFANASYACVSGFYNNSSGKPAYVPYTRVLTAYSNNTSSAYMSSWAGDGSNAYYDLQSISFAAFA